MDNYKQIDPKKKPLSEIDNVKRTHFSSVFAEKMFLKDVLMKIVDGIKVPVLLFVLGYAVVLAIAAIWNVETLRVLSVPVLFVFIVGISVYVFLEYLSFRKQILERMEIPIDSKDASGSEVSSQTRTLTDDKYNAGLEELVDYQLQSDEVFHNLLRRFGECVGRDQEIKELLRILSMRWPIIAVQGIGGVGKTTLALELAYICVESQTFSAIIWVSARDHKLAFPEVLEIIAKTLGFVHLTEQSLERQKLIIQELFRCNQCLIIIDNYETISDPLIDEFILEIPEPSKAIITTRSQTIQQVWLYQLKGLDWQSSLNLIRQEGQRLNIEAVSESPEDEWRPLFEVTGGNPLAMKWAVGQIKEQGQSLDVILADLQNAKGDIFENIFERSFLLLSDSARSVLTILPIFASSSGYEAIKSVSHQSQVALDRSLAQLIEMSLVETSDELDADAIRYSIHPMTRTFAESKLDNMPDYRDASYKRYIDFFKTYVEKNSGWTDWRGLEAIEKEWVNILRAMNWCKNKRLHKEYALFRAFLSNFLWMHNYWDFAIKSGKQAIQYARELNDLEITVELLQSVGWILFSQGKLQEAGDFYDACALIYKEGLEDLDGFARLHNYYGRLALVQGELSKAQQHFQDCLSMAKDPLTISFCKSALGDVALDHGDLENALVRYDEVRLLRETSDDRSRLASVLCDLGEVSTRQGNYIRAQEFYNRSVEIGMEIGRKDVIGRGKRGLAYTLSLQGEYAISIELTREALNLFNQLGAVKEIKKTKSLLSQVTREGSTVIEESTSQVSNNG